MSEPMHQTNWRKVGFLLAGFLGLGEVLHAVSGAIEIVTPVVTYLQDLIGSFSGLRIGIADRRDDETQFFVVGQSPLPLGPVLVLVRITPA